MAKFELTDEQIAAISKALPDLGLVEKADDSAEVADPVADVMIGLHEAVATIGKSATGDKDTLLADAFEKAFAELDKIRGEDAELAYAAGTATVVTKAAVRKDDAKDGKKKADGEDENEDGNPDDEDEEDMSKVLKGLPSKAAEAFASITKANTEMATRIAKMEAENEVRLLKAQAAELGEPDSFVETLKSLDQKGRDALIAVVKAKNAQIKKGNLFGEIGTGTPAGSTGALDQINAKAAEIVKAAGGKVTLAKAFGQVCASEPALYAEYKRDTYGK